MKFLSGTLVLMLLWCCTSKQANSAAETSNKKSVVESIVLKDLAGSPIDLNQYKGKTLFINFWATWCGPCIREMPSIVQAKSKLDSDKVEFIFASNETVERINNFKQQNNYDISFVQLENLEELNILALPTTYIINAKGELVFSEAGFRQWDDTANLKLISDIINAP